MCLSNRGTSFGCFFRDEPSTDKPITGSVGSAGKNLKADVRTIQQYLNAFLPIEGGPDLVLAEDGLVGPKTITAISKFQKQVLGFSDGRVDVNGPTIKALTKKIIESPEIPFGKLGAAQTVAPNAETPAASTPGAGTANTGPASSASTLGADIVLVANSVMRFLEPQLNLLRFKLARTNNNMLALLNKHFATKKETVNSKDIAHVQKILASIHFFVARSNNFGKFAAENVILFDPAPPGNVIGHTVRGGDKLGIKKIQIYKDKNGVVTKNPGQSIWLTSRFADQPTHTKHWVMLHEFCHFVGARDGVFTKIDDNAYAFDQKFLTISKFAKLHNAESLSLFFLEACIGTKATTILPRLSTHKAHFEAAPTVSPAGALLAA